MSERTGNISVQTADIFPIIKKWLYSEHDIFLRELVANATDAITKRSTHARLDNKEMPQGAIKVTVDPKAKTLTITDNGLGMDEAEVEKYLAQLAFSGAEEFVKNMKDQGADSGKDIIGKFGLGFYSAFMVSTKVEVETLSMKDGAKPTKWTCLGDPTYTFSESNKTEVGTSITLHLAEDSQEFLNKFKVNETLRKFCDFMPYPISVNEVNEKNDDEPTVINETKPLWRRDPSELKDEDYLNFYKNMFPMDQAPLFWIHLKVDHPFTLEGILYFPKLNPMRPMNERNIRLYAKQVFVSDDVKNVIPDFLSLLKGAIDSSDIPLNVSRSSLQGDPNITRISNYVTKKVAEALKKLFKNDREKYESIWGDIGMFIKYGCISDPKFDEAMRSMVVFKNSEGKFNTLTEYRENIPAEMKEKMGDQIVYFEKEKGDRSLRSQLLEQGIQTIETDDHIDPHFTQHVEMKKQGEDSFQFVASDSVVADLLGSEATGPEDIKVKEIFEKVLNANADDKDKQEVEIQKLKSQGSPAWFKVDEQMKRFQKMAQSMGNDSAFPLKKTLVINPSNPLIQNALKLHERGDKNDLVDKICRHVEDLASISSEGLKNDQRDLFVTRSQTLISELTNLAL
ncbi:MAG: molecular chaperone HtpG [Bdellovibrionales bacterium CG12_big_fil_rev_8_21_14_0_65_38_15]|nr:MAG: molecular chaperone HtpG [Bdellovibrionales bacterium CG22_combo_CG10-13_8_21_14_all_38_13]PIQ54094.1 MAG: molecular chaperone HtpG [Bdellovibrionales bacterium CG12_big_fil_rev_8_21_14_0_65_38_15]PIR28619.1 MAG: molecular chaperone HtpG [Bdellovibrionales bacterium CG11_big_fil_rev_8_21_14_0_20_38_13]